MSDIRNKDGIWINSNLFREDALHYKKYGYYCSDPWGSSAWYEYWKEQRKRIIEGFEVGGAKITGDHYFYLNFCPINKSEDTSSKRSRKVLDFPDFWDGDYDYFWARDIAKKGICESLNLSKEEIDRLDNLDEEDKIKELEKYYSNLKLFNKIRPYALEGGYNLIVGKSRRKGYSFKNAAVGVKNYFTSPNSLTIYSAYEKKYLYPKGIFTMATNYINFINDNTAWIMPSDYVDRTDHRRASYKEYKNGVQIEKGFKSEIMALTFKDNPDVTRGKDAIDLIIEEAGAFGTPGLLKNCYAASEDTVKDGEIKTGLITIFGCVCKGTKVWDKKGRLVNIEDITKDTGIIGYGGIGTTKEHIPYLQPPTKKECLRITTNKGFSIECSTDHPLLWSKNHWVKDLDNRKKVTFKRASNIKIGEQLMRVRQVPNFGEEIMKYPRLVGLLIGDGYYGKDSTPQLCIADEGIFDYLNSLGLKYTIYKDCDEMFYKYVGLKDFQKNLKILGIYGQIKQEKRLPIDIWKYDYKSICELLGGYFDADGSISHNVKKNSYKITLTSVVKELLEEVEIQLYKLGIRCRIFERTDKSSVNIKSKINKKESTINSSKSYTLEIHSITDIIEFKKHIYFTDKKKQIILDSVDTKRKGRDKYDNCLFIESEDVPNTFFDKKNIPFNNLEACYVTSIENIGLQPIYNLNAGVSHTYITNGFISKNTSGDMEGGTADYAEMFMNPERFGLLPFEDVWEDEEKFKGGTTGFFHPAHLNLPGAYDNNGNSNLEQSKNIIINERTIRASKGATATDIAKLCQEKPLKPREAFAYSTFNIFPTFEIQKRLDTLKIKGWDKLKGQPVNLYRDPDTQKVVAEPDMKNELQPIREYRYKGPDLGAVVIYEQPISNPPKGLYKIGYDPVRQDNGTSLSAIIVYKGFDKNSFTKNKIVAEYIGRTETPDDAHHIAELLAEFYNTQIMYENEVPDVKTYFLRRKKLHLLALQPDGVIKKNIKNSSVNRVYGCHMNGPLKDAAERYTKEWLLQIDDYDENEQPIRTLDKLESTRLLEELILYERKGNYDLLSALFMCLIQLNEEYIDKDYKESVAKRNARKLIEDMYRINNNNVVTWMV